MHSRSITRVAMAAACLSGVCVKPARSEDPKKAPAEAARMPQQAASTAAERGLLFLEKDVVKWRKDKGCATCHHGTMTVWALSEAKARGYAVDAENLADIVQWTKGRFVPHLDQPRDPRPGWGMVSTPALYLGAMTQDLPILSRTESTRLAGHLVRHQEADGSISWSAAPAANRYPPFFESDEVATLLALLAWEPHLPADPKGAAAARAGRDKAAEWLSRTKPTGTTQAAAYRLLLEVRDGTPAEQLQPGIDQLLSRQQSDGGWGQVKDAPSDAYATGQSLYALSCAGVKEDRAEVQRAVSFLVATQREDGSWPMTPRAHPGAKPAKNLMPITYFGSAWATLGLVRFVPPAFDPATTHRRALEEIRLLDGKVEVDEDQPDKPVVRAFFQGYEINDVDLAHATENLAAFPKLTTLRIKSPRVTDAGLEGLKRLPRLRSLVLENASITDAGLGRLKAVSDLEELDLKGTKVTDAGVKDFQAAMPGVKVGR